MDKTIIRLLGAIIIAALALAVIAMNPVPRLVIGIIVGLPSFLLMLISRRQLGDSFSVMPEAKTLVTTGLYYRIQHPMYFFLDLLLVSIIVILKWSVLLWVWIILVVVQILQSRKEEKVLSVAFGAEYKTYQKQTWF
jgi:protein-S-isoprenylcysteine O-methyltransferase Ste14